MQLRVVCYFLAALFLVSGGAKLASLPFEVEAFERWGYPLALMYVTGTLEVAGALGLLVPRLSSLASICLAGLMLGAIGTHAMHGEWPMFVVALVITATAAWRGWQGRKEILRLFGGSSS